MGMGRIVRIEIMIFGNTCNTIDVKRIQTHLVFGESIWTNEMDAEGLRYAKGNLLLLSQFSWCSWKCERVIIIKLVQFKKKEDV